MKNLDKSENLEEMKSLFLENIQNKKPIVVWQKDPNEQRIIHPMCAFDIDIESDFIKFNSIVNKEVNFEPSKVFFYDEEQKIIYKSSIQNISSDSLTVLIPDKILSVSDEEMDSFVAKIDLDSFNIFVEGQGLANEFHDEMRVSGEGQDIIDEVTPELVEGNGEGNYDYDEHLKGTQYSAEEMIDNYQRDDNTTDHLDKYQSARTTTEKISGFQVAKTSTENLSTKEYTKTLKTPPSFEEIKGEKKAPPTFAHDGPAPEVDDPWSMDSMSSHDSDLFEKELSFISLDEEDKLYADQRAAPRAKPPEGKMVTIQSQTPGKKAGIYTLHDLSQGGMGFIIFDKSEYEVGEVINIIGFDDNNFEQPMVVEIKAIREADELGVKFKVGCAFIKV